MESLPLELIEHILSFCPASQVCQCARLSHTWLKAKQNLERANRHFWQWRCRREIPHQLIFDLNTWLRPLEQLEEYECKKLYQKWYRTGGVGRKPNAIVESSSTFGNGINQAFTVSSLAVSGSVVVTGHLTGRVHVTDVMNDGPPLTIVEHLSDVTDLALVNLTDREKFQFFKEDTTEDTDEDFASFSAHHHVISVGIDGRIYISLIGRQKSRPFEISSQTQRQYLKVRLHDDLFAVSAKKTVDISLFRLIKPSDEDVSFKTRLKAMHITNVDCEQLSRDVYHWLGLFTFANGKIHVSNCHSHSYDVIMSTTVNLDPEGTQSLEWTSNKELLYECNDDFLDNINVATIAGSSFGDHVFFVITSLNQILFTTEDNTFRPCPIDRHLVRYDKVICLTLFGQVLAFGTQMGYLLVFHCPQIKCLRLLDRCEPVFFHRLSQETITKVSFADHGFGPALAAATARKVYLINWFDEALLNPSLEEIITIE